jgi:hypothetical protein
VTLALVGSPPNTAPASWPARQADAARAPRETRLSLPAIAAASIASASAALITSHVWGRGTLVAAALTPVIVALLSELLQGSGRRILDLPYRLKIALLTAVIAFAVAAGLLTAPELITGKSLAGGDRATTYFGGKEDTSGATAIGGQAVEGPAPVGGGQSPDTTGGSLAAPVIAESVAFGQTTAGVPVSLPIEVSNPNSSEISLSGATVLGDVSETSSPGDFSHDGACSTVPAGSTCTITATFLPLSPEPPGGRTAVLRFADDGAGNERTVALSGEVLATTTTEPTE